MGNYYRLDERPTYLHIVIKLFESFTSPQTTRESLNRRLRHFSREIRNVSAH